MKPRFAQFMTGALIAVAALSACRREVPSPTPTPDRDPKPTVHAGYRAAFAGAAFLIGR